jgi:signal transduction histidine kinase
MRFVAASDGTDRVPSAAAPLAEPESESSAAVRTLQLLLLLTIVVPLVLGLAGGFVSYREHYAAAAAALDEADAVAEENTTKILDTHLLVAARIDDLLSGLSDAQIRDQEGTLHQRIAQQIAPLPQVAAAWVIDSSGRELVSARVYPVNRDLDQSGRDDFRALEHGPQQTFIWALRARSLEGGDLQPYFTVSRRRQSPDGQFEGVIVVAVSGPYFASFYNSLLGTSAQYTASVMREDGSILAHYPENSSPIVPRRDDALLATAIGRKATGGLIASGSPFSRKGSLVAYRRLANYPIYVAVGRTRAAISYEWLAKTAGYAAIAVPAAIGLMLLCLVALRRTRREQRALAQARDALTQRAAVEAQLHQAQKMEAVGLLTAGIAHDFNNLLTIVSGNIALLNADADSVGAKHRRFIAAAISGCERASALTNRLLSFAGREPLDPRPVDVNEVIARVTDLPWRTLGDRIAVEFRPGPDLWPVFVDAGQLENALLNLALNARDAMGGVGRLTIETLNQTRTADEPGLAAGDYVAISVADTGSGMPKEVVERAFDPFFTTKEAGKGTGLGLSQVYGFVTRSGGYCAIDSEPGRGTTVYLYLLRHTAAPDAATVVEPPPADAAGRTVIPLADMAGGRGSAL